MEYPLLYSKLQDGDFLLLLTVAGLYLVAINICTFVIFLVDKLLASCHCRRVPEVTLLAFALVGGSAGAWLGRLTWRHKTQKKLFSILLHGIFVSHCLLLVAGVCYYCFPFSRWEKMESNVVAMSGYDL